MIHNALARQILGERAELFADDFAAAEAALAQELAASCVLVIGAGGSIGRATVEVLLGLRPRRTL